MNRQLQRTNAVQQEGKGKTRHRNQEEPVARTKKQQTKLALERFIAMRSLMLAEMILAGGQTLVDVRADVIWNTSAEAC